YLVAIAPETKELPPGLLELWEENGRLATLRGTGSRPANIQAGPVLLGILRGLAQSTDEDLAAAATAALADFAPTEQ
ncbi:MAG TPA: hypothetical protein PLX89_20000, partial [Verrucomicrobiota bacterium]|nr:hypothetical protein [Verrucomicrobiota bacterium]